MIMYYIGIDIGGTRLKAGLMENDRLVKKRILAARPGGDFASHVDMLDEAIADLLQDIPSLAGIGMAFPGLVDPCAKKVLSTNQKYDDAVWLDLKAYYERRWRAPFFIENDARMAAVGEWKYGGGRGTDDLVMVTIGTGIGTAVILQGRLLRGKHFQAGCLGGHFVLDYRGRGCTCGNVGCAEAEASTWSLPSLVGSHPHFRESSLRDCGTIDFAELFGAALKGDRVAGDVKRHCLEVWAAAVISYIHAYDPERVLLGGGILQSAGEIVPYIRERVAKHAWTPWGQPVIECATLGDDAAILGVVHFIQQPL